MATDYYFYINTGEFINTEQIPPVFEIFNKNKCGINLIIVDKNTITSRINLGMFLECIIKEFNPIENPKPKPFVLVSDFDISEISKYLFTSVISNSSIWIRYLDITNLSKKNFNISNLIKGLKINRKYYKNINAKEYIDYNLRLQAQNYLKDAEGGHGDKIIPQIYSDELECEAALENINPFNNFNFHKPEIIKFNNAIYNILLIDDKPEKGEIIKNLLNHFKGKDIEKKTVWCEGKAVCELFENEKISELTIIDWVKKHNNKIRIFQVKNIRDAIKLLSNYNFKKIHLRFDLILMDYLLDKVNNNDREFSTKFFKWFSEDSDEEKKDTFDLSSTNKKLIRAIKDNRGPLQKFWIFPITAFNQTFIDDLKNNNVRLIDYYWHISRGADPINTPYLFLRSLNMFLYLQLQQAVYDLKTLINFLNKTIERIQKVKAKDFQAFMGSEYIVLIQKHGWRSVICNDAKAGSLFSKYIWEHFYENIDENKYLFRLMDKMQKFYHKSTYSDENDYDKVMLYWKELDIFLSDNWTNLIDEYTNSILKALVKFNMNDDKTEEKRKKILSDNNINKPNLSCFRIKINSLLDRNKTNG